jgi:hypothetical protein
MFNGKRIVAAGVFVSLTTVTSFAQTVTVQQPTFNSFSVGTTVSVPDGGGAYVGGVSQAGAFRARSGSFPSGTSTGVSRSDAGVSVHVVIHDLSEMDRLLLESPAARRVLAGETALNGHARFAYQALLDGGNGRNPEALSEPASNSIVRVSPRVTGKIAVSTGAAKTAASAVESCGAPLPALLAGGERGDAFYQLGLEAERRGATGVARLHFRIAARHGSVAAVSKLAVTPLPPPRLTESVASGGP